jgi:hypothetical protein
MMNAVTVTRIENGAVITKRTMVRTIAGTVRAINLVVVEMRRTENESMKARRNTRSATRRNHRTSTSMRNNVSLARRISYLWETRLVILRGAGFELS